MNHLSKKLLLVAAIFSVFVLARGSQASDPVKEPKKQKYMIYAGSCSRSIRLVATHDDANAACWAASGLRDKAKYVGIVTGNVGSPLFLIGSTNNVPGLKSCSVYELPCKAFQWKATTRTSQDANLVAETARTRGATAEIIYHFADKEE